MNKYLEKALEIAKTSKCRYKHGCVVVNNGKIVSSATNKKVGSPETAWRKSHVHAEAAAIIAAGAKAYGATVYVARSAADGSAASSKPCKKCNGYLARYRVFQVRWT
jgi:pyrimidine deaminase RibD-like protein